MRRSVTPPSGGEYASQRATRDGLRGRRSQQWGVCAEAAAARVYAARGAELLESRKRTAGGEIDLVLKIGTMIVFAEVKARRRMADALRAAPARGWTRRSEAALAYAAEIGHSGAIRLDLAAVDGNGDVEILENVGMAASF